MSDPVKIAVLSDIHGNFPALCGAIRTMERKGAERIIAAGDIVGRGPHPVEVIRLLRQRGIPGIVGNMERKLLNLYRVEKSGESPKRRKSHFAWTARQLRSSEWDFLLSLPTEIEFQLEGFKILVVHGSPLSDADSIYPSITFEGLRAKLSGKSPDMLICGHTHIPFVKQLNGVWVVNCGAVGMSGDGDPRGSFAFIEFTRRTSPRCDIVRFSYPYTHIIEDLERRVVPGVKKETFLRGVE